MDFKERDKMRRRYRMAADLGSLPIELIPIPTKSRDELPPLLRALQYIYCNPELRESVFSVLEKGIALTNIGTPGMSLWEILVIGVMRLTLDADYDRLEYIVNYDELVRAMLGVQKFGAVKKEYSVQTLRDNTYLLDEAMLEEINEIVVKHGLELKKKGQSEKECNKGLAVKIDSYAVESNVHFPTDYNLLWDSARKSLELTKILLKEHPEVKGWRKIDQLLSSTKSRYEHVRRSSHRGGINRDSKLKSATRKYVKTTRELSKRLHKLEEEIGREGFEKVSWKEWAFYLSMLDKHIDLLRRRVLKKEKIPHEEKVFSIFEPYTEWISKGKANRSVELGLKVAIATEKNGFILQHIVMEKQQDVDITVSWAKELSEKFNIESYSWDKGFWSKENYKQLEYDEIFLVMPKKGKCSKAEHTREHSPEFIRLRKQHSAVESDINMLEHHGVNRCPDRGIRGFKRYVALGVLGYNLHRLGNLLLEQDRSIQRQAA